MRSRSLIGVVGAGVLALTACGGGGDYCGAVEALKDEFVNLDQAIEPGDTETLDAMISAFSDAADAAPDEIADQWGNLTEAMETLVGVEGDFSQLDEEQMAEFQAMAGDADAVAEHALEECDIDLEDT